MDCQKLFETYNARYFGGRLPAYRVIQSDRYGLQGLCRSRQRQIHLRTDLHGHRLKQTLLHEMAHAATNGGHDKEWLAEMLRLADMGAPTREDWELYKDPSTAMTWADIADECNDAGLNTDLPWRSVRREVGWQHGLTTKQGRTESKSAAKVLRRFRKEFNKGRRDRREYAQAKAAFAVKFGNQAIEGL